LLAQEIVDQLQQLSATIPLVIPLLILLAILRVIFLVIHIVIRIESMLICIVILTFRTAR